MGKYKGLILIAVMAAGFYANWWGVHAVAKAQSPPFFPGTTTPYSPVTTTPAIGYLSESSDHHGTLIKAEKITDAQKQIVMVSKTNLDAAQSAYDAAVRSVEEAHDCKSTPGYGAMTFWTNTTISCELDGDWVLQRASTYSSFVYSGGAVTPTIGGSVIAN